MKNKKVVLIGDEAVGKTSLIRKFILDQFNDKYIATIGAKVSKKELDIDGTGMKLLIWDVLGQQGYTATQEMSFEGAAGAILVTDLTRKATLESLTNYWIPHLQNAAGKIPFIFLANKADLEHNWQFDNEDISELARVYDSPAMITSARTGQNVEEAFISLGRAMQLKKEDPELKDSPHRAKEINTVIDATDFIIENFCSQYKDEEHCMAIIRQQFHRANVDITSPTLDGLVMVVDQLEVVEKSFRGEVEATRNRTMRRSVLKKVE